MIPEEIIERVREKDIVSVLEDEGLVLKRAGANYTCCCPFHSEKTPSFVVSPNRNTAHCFGSCGRTWDNIQFIRDRRNMEFHEAVEYLARRMGLTIEEHEPTPEERERNFKKDSLQIILTAAQEYFVKSFGESPGAKEYCQERGWNEEMIALFGIGYAPGRFDGLVEYLMSKGYKKEKIIEAGLAKTSERDEDFGKPYDFFRERITFPIFDKHGELVGFSGRYIGKSDKVRSKYLNSPEIILSGDPDKDPDNVDYLFKKGEILFGWQQAYRQIKTQQIAVLCEGNPDVIRLHQIGINYAIAPLGTAFTPGQMGLLKDRAKTVILMQDVDDSGMSAREKSGKMLIEAGFCVRVMVWEKDLAKDPDEYFLKHPKDYESMLANNTEDFIPWLCHRLMAGKRSQTEIVEVISTIAPLLAQYSDQAAAKMYIEAFGREYKNTAKIWNAEYVRASNQLEREAVSQDKKMQDMLQTYGFYIKDNSYYGAGSSSNDRRWSNFILTPILHIKDERDAKRIYSIVNVKRQEAVIKLNQSELVSFTDFKRRIESAGNYIWESTADSLTQLKKYLYDDTPSANEIKQLGWQKRYGFYAWGNGGLDGGHFVKADKYGILKIKDQLFYLPGCAADTEANTQGYQTERRFVYTETNNVTLKEYTELFVKCYGDNGKVALCFLIATLFRDIVISVSTTFPLLNLFGPKGTGKSQLGHSLRAFFVTGGDAPNLSGSTKAALAAAVAEVSNAIVHLEEYKKEIGFERHEFLKGIWEGTGRSRMNMDNDKRRENTAVDCGVVFSGQEMATGDIALFNRVLFLSFYKTTYTEQERRDFEDLQRIERKGLTHLTAQLLELRNLFSGRYRHAYDETLTDVNQRTRLHNVDDRTLRNWVTVLAAFRAVESELHFPFTYDDALELCSSLAINQNAKTIQNNELSGFWETVDSLVSSSRIWIQVDYKIKTGKPIKVLGGGVVELHPDKKYLFVNFNRLAELYMKVGRESGGKTIPKESLKYYLEHTPEFMGTEKSEKFKLIDNQQGYTPADNNATRTRTTTAMVFDYELIRSTYNIDLEVGTGYQPDEDAAPSETPAIEIAGIFPEDMPEI